MLKVKRIITGELEENCYVIEKDNKCLIIDPGADFEKIKKEIEFPVLAILITHRHEDHIGALDEVSSAYPCQLFDYFTTTEETYKLDSFEFNVVRTKGHTNDSVSFYFFNDRVLFTGDFLFKRSIGRTDLGGNDDDMNRSLHKIKKFPKDITIYPGHGDATTLEKELEENPFLW